MGWVSQVLELLSKPFIWWVVVAPWESGIRSRLGKHITVLGPGIHWRFPFIDRVYIQSVRLRMISDSGQTMTTSDGKAVTISVAIQYCIIDIHRLFTEVAHPESTLLHHVHGLIAQTVSQTTSAELSPTMLEEKVTAQTPSEKWGLGQVKVWIISYAIVKTYRLMMNEYRSFSAGNDLDAAAQVK